MQIYLGAPLFTHYHRKVLDQLTEIMEGCGYTVFSPLEESRPIWNGRAPVQCSASERLQVVEMNYRGIRESALMFAWAGGWNPADAVFKELESRRGFDAIFDELDSDTMDELDKAIRRASPSLPDTGVAVEIGYARALDRPILGYLHDDETDRQFNLMLSDGTMSGIARGLDQLEFQLNSYFDTGELMEFEAFESEPEDHNG